MSLVPQEAGYRTQTSKLLKKAKVSMTHNILEKIVYLFITLAGFLVRFWGPFVLAKHAEFEPGGSLTLTSGTLNMEHATKHFANAFEKRYWWFKTSSRYPNGL